MENLIKKIYRQVSRHFFTTRVKLMCKSAGENLIVNHKSSVTKHTILGSNVNFNGMEITGGGNVSIGDNFHSGRQCLMITQYHNYDGGKAIPYDDTYVMKDIVIEDNVWVGDRVIILGGVTIGEGAIIQAGSVVVKSIPKYSIAGGHPAAVFKTRDINHYEYLKAHKKFY